MSALLGLSTWLVVLGSLGVASLVAIGGRWILRRWVIVGDLGAAASVAGPLMPALGALFALLCALALTTEAGVLRAANDNASTEAAAASRLAWAATSPGVPTETVQDALGTYLASTRTREWVEAARDGDPATKATLRRLELVVRDAAASKELNSAEAGELLGSLDAVTVARRQRLAELDSTLPQLSLLVVLVSGLALVANSAGLALAHPRRTALLTGGLVMVVGLTIGLLLAVSAPFEGGFPVKGRPIDLVRSDLDAGAFQR